MASKTTNERERALLDRRLSSQMDPSMPAAIRRGLEGWRSFMLLAIVAMCLGGVAGTATAKPKPRITFDMVRSTAATNANCAADARATVKVTSLGPVEEMDVKVSGLPPNTEFDFFVIQLPNAPFGLAWYQGDIETDHKGEGRQRFRGRFNIETFIVAQPPGNQPAPFVHNQAFPDAVTNPATEPVH